MQTYTRYFSAGNEQTPPVLLVHGAGEHLDRYLWVIQRLNEAGFSVFGGDLPGYGRSEGKRGHINSFIDYINSVQSWYDELKKLTLLPPFIMGHSLGGLVVARLMEKVRPETMGVILSSPCFGLCLEVPVWKEWIAKGLNVLSPTLVLSAGIRPNHVTRNKEISERYAKDPLNTKGASVRWYNELTANMQANQVEQSSFPNVPLLIHQAGSDYIVNAEKVKQWYDSLTIKDKKYREWPGLYHEILNEPERENVLQEMIDWMKMRQNYRGTENAD